MKTLLGSTLAPGNNVNFHCGFALVFVPTIFNIVEQTKAKMKKTGCLGTIVAERERERESLVGFSIILVPRADYAQGVAYCNRANALLGINRLCWPDDLEDLALNWLAAHSAPGSLSTVEWPSHTPLDADFPVSLPKGGADN